MTGDGLRFALRGGELAAAAALDELASGTPAFRALHQARATEFAGKWRINRALRSLVASPRGVSFAASLASLWAAPVQHLVAIAGDVHLLGCGADPCGPRLREP
jgi:flavin-dependent dehydrogenase